jgi:uncharacterized protein (TIGR00304 family)
MLELVFVGIGLIVVGFLVVLMSTAMSGRSSEEEERRTEVRGGGIIMIGPIPIIFGSDAKWASAAIVLAIVLIVIVLLFGVLIGR